MAVFVPKILSLYFDLDRVSFLKEILAESMLFCDGIINSPILMSCFFGFFWLESVFVKVFRNAELEIKVHFRVIHEADGIG